MITGNQCSMGRTLMGWTQADLADAVGLSIDTIKKFENNRGAIKEDTLNSIYQALSDNGIEFLKGEGIRRRQDTLTVYDGDDFYLKLLDDIYYTLKEKKGELLYMFVDNSLSPPEVIKSEARIRKIANVRSMVREGDTYLLYPLKEYRFIPGQHYMNYNVVIFGDKVATMLDNNTKAMVVRDRNGAEVMRNIFNQLWNIYETPTKTTAPETYE
ncbi:helix-turn-helix domain-containing protein [Seonamhaeicola sp. MEBiC1930]|uniref:helix-turn-helix domain-containing protein n=1 Tax=Seonamhaeicola sp. MEBiC01930 TaxID=2976768 RepID=UPI00324F06DE